MGGLPDPNSGCRKHSNHKQLPGVCSFCLRESLSKLTNADDDSNATAANYSSRSSSPAYSSASSFSPAVVAKAAAVEDRKPRQQHRRRNGSDDHGGVNLGFLLGEGNGGGDLGLKKSRSVGCAPRISRGGNGNANCNGKGNGNTNCNGKGNGNGVGGERGEKKGGKKSGSVGFWKRLIHSTSKKTKGVLMHSSTMKERFHDMSSSSSRRL